MALVAKWIFKDEKFIGQVWIDSDQIAETNDHQNNQINITETPDESDAA